MPVERSLITIHRTAEAALLVEDPTFVAPEGANSSSGGSWLRIERGPSISVLTGAAAADATSATAAAGDAAARTRVYGLFGILELEGAALLLTIEERRLAGTVQGHKVDLLTVAPFCLCRRPWMPDHVGGGSHTPHRR